MHGVSLKFVKAQGRREKGTLSLLPCVFAFLFSNPEALDQIGVAIRILPLQVIEQAPALANQFQEAAARVMILGVRLEVFRQVVNPLAEERDLNFR
jgi:hypothetical protein